MLRPEAAAAAAHPELAPQLMQIAALRSELRSLRGAIDAQRPRLAQANMVVRESAAIRSDLALLSSSMDGRRRALRQMRASQEDVDRLAEAVASAARHTTDTLRRDREHEQSIEQRWRQAEPRVNPAMPLPLRVAAAADGMGERAPLAAADREAMLTAARERMRRRGVLGDVGAAGGGLAAAASGDGAGNMFDRLSHWRAAQERVASAAITAVQGEPVVDEMRLIRPLADDCSICLEPRRKGDSIWVLRCGHAFHAACCRRWLCGACTCPLCKRPVERKPPGVPLAAAEPEVGSGAHG